MGLDLYSRRKYRHKKFVYLLDDEEKTAWIAQGHIGRGKRYRIPEFVMVDGERYSIESVEIGAFNHPRTLRHLVVPDSIEYVDGDVFHNLSNLRSVYIGKGVKYLNQWNFRLCPNLRIYHIDQQNPYLTQQNGMILTKDGKTLLAGFAERQHITIPEGVEEIEGVAFWYHKKLETVSFSKTLRKIGDCCFDGCPNLRDVVLPEGFEKLMIQSFMENPGLRHIDLPSTLTDLGWENFVDCPNLETVILRSPKKLDFNRNFGAHFQSLPMKDPCLYVPAELVGQYREDPEWQMFKRILPI